MANLAAPAREANTMPQGASDGDRSLPSAKHDVVWVVLVWGRVVVGLTLAATAGIAFGHAWTNQYAPLWVVGAISLLTGVLLVLSGLYARSRPVEAPPAELVAPPVGEKRHEPVVPLLGALLVYKYRIITQQQLSNALEQQHKQRGRLLGEILLQNGWVTEQQLQTALAYQQQEAQHRESDR
jgi:hypothetical protein